MKSKSIKTKMAVALASAMTATMVVPANASQVFSFDQYLVFDTSLGNTPTASINYDVTLSSGEAVTGKPVVSSAEFNSATMSYTERQEGDTVVFEAEQSYAKSKVTVDLSTVTFTEPGEYVYNICARTETPGVSITDGIRQLKITTGYEVENGTPTNNLMILSVVLEGPLPEIKGRAMTAKKTDQYNLDLTKVVAGSQGSSERYFQFEIAFSNVKSNKEYTVDLSQATAELHDGRTVDWNEEDKPNGVYTQPSKVQLSNDPTATNTFRYYLKHGETISFKDLPNDIVYKIIEIGAEDYDTTWNSTGRTQTLSGTNKVVDFETLGRSSDVISITNRKDGSIPTGVSTSIIPATIITALATIFGVFFTKRKKH